MSSFMACMKANGNYNEFCRVESMKYLKCRMERGLMAEEKLEALGFANVTEEESRTRARGGDGGGGDSSKPTTSEHEQKKEQTGYIAGMSTKPVESKSA